MLHKRFTSTLSSIGMCVFLVGFGLLAGSVAYAVVNSIQVQHLEAVHEFCKKE